MQVVMFLLLGVAGALACAIGYAACEYVIEWMRRRG